MAVAHYTLTLNGSAQALSTASGATVNSLRTVMVQHDTANANPIRVGASGVTTSDYGVYIPAPASATSPPAPLILGDTQGILGHFKLSDVYVIGTNAEKVHLLVVTI